MKIETFIPSWMTDGFRCKECLETQKINTVQLKKDKIPVVTIWHQHNEKCSHTINNNKQVSFRFEVEKP